MIRLSAFADEISPDLDEQIVALKAENIHYLDLRGVWDINVLDLNDEQVARIKQALDAQNIRVAAIASPIGKVSIKLPFELQIQRFERAIWLAQFFQTPYIRIFSFYPPGHDPSSSSSTINREATNRETTNRETTNREATNREATNREATSATPDQAAWRNEVIARLRVFTARASTAGITLVHENDGGTYGESITHCVDVLQSVADPHLRAVFDPANFIQCHQEPYPAAYEQICPWLGYIHVKDALADGKVVAAGEGIARWPDLLCRLRADSYDGFFALEPHLMAMGQYGGFSGPDLFHHASQAFQHLLKEADWVYA